MARNKAKLTPQQQAQANVANKAKHGVGVTLHTSGKPIKGLAAQPMPKPNAANTRVVASIGKHPGTGNCIKRWHLYTAGQSIMHAITTAGQTPNDLTFWAKCGYLKLRPATAQEFAAWQAAYAKQQGKGAKGAKASAPQGQAKASGQAKAKASAPQGQGQASGQGAKASAPQGQASGQASAPQGQASGQAKPAPAPAAS